MNPTNDHADGREARLPETIAHYAAEFINRESNRNSLITVTRVELNESRTRVTVFVSVFPETDEEHALAFLTRIRDDCRRYIGDHLRRRNIPGLTFVIDEGEKNRRRIDELTQTG